MSDYWREKAEKTLRDLDDARRELAEVREALRPADDQSLANKAGEIRDMWALANNTADRRGADRDALAAELSELRSLALDCERAASVEAMKMGAMALIARLARPPERVGQLGVRAAGEALRSLKTADNDERETT